MEARKNIIIKGLVSIIVPVYNKEQYIEECCYELGKQEYKNYEIIIVDDGSTDESPALCDSMAEKYTSIRVFHTTNHGVSAARNYGIREAHGEWLMFVDVDDFPMPNMISSLIGDDIDLAVCNWMSEDHIPCSKRFRSEVEYCSMRDDDEYLLCTPDFFKTIWNKLFKTEIVHKNGLHYEEELCHAEDALFAIDYFCSLEKDAKIKMVREPLYYHRLDVKGSLVTDRNIQRWTTSAEYWWKHIDKNSMSEAVKANMQIRSLQNEFMLCAMRKDYQGVKTLLKQKGNLINGLSLKHWPLIRRLFFATKNPMIIYMVNLIWCRMQ